MFEQAAGELHAKLMIDSHNWATYSNRGPSRGAGGRWRGLAGNTQTISTARLEAAARPAGPGRASRRRAERSSQRGRRAGGQATRRPETRRRPEHQRRHKLRGRLAGGPLPTGTHSGQAHRAERAAAGHAKGAGTEVPAPSRLTQPLPRRGSGRMDVSPGDGDASTGTCRQRRPLPGQPRRSGRRSRCGRGPSSAWWPGRRARRNRSSRR